MLRKKNKGREKKTSELRIFEALETLNERSYVGEKNIERVFSNIDKITANFQDEKVTYGYIGIIEELEELSLYSKLTGDTIQSIVNETVEALDEILKKERCENILSKFSMLRWSVKRTAVIAAFFEGVSNKNALIRTYIRRGLSALEDGGTEEENIIRNLFQILDEKAKSVMKGSSISISEFLIDINTRIAGAIRTHRFIMPRIIATLMRAGLSGVQTFISEMKDSSSEGKDEKT